MWHRHPACIASGVTYYFSIRLPAPCTNNLAEYEAVSRGMELLVEVGAEAVEVFGDSMLVISQLMEEYRSQNVEANDLAQKASGYKASTNKADFPVQFLKTGDWRADIFNYLKDPARGHLGRYDRRP
jgi:ribonuclease HI